jgi:hypothetical protein
MVPTVIRPQPPKLKNGNDPINLIMISISWGQVHIGPIPITLIIVLKLNLPLKYISPKLQLQSLSRW